MPSPRKSLLTTRALWDTLPRQEIKILALHGILHLRGYDHEQNDRGQMARREAKLRREFRLPVGLIERAGASQLEEARLIGVGIGIVVLLLALLTLVSYVDRVYQEIGKFLSREFQDNIDSFEQIVEPRLGVGASARRSRWPFCTQLMTAAIAMIVGFTRVSRSSLECV